MNNIIDRHLLQAFSAFDSVETNPKPLSRFNTVVSSAEFLLSKDVSSVNGKIVFKGCLTGSKNAALRVDIALPFILLSKEAKDAFKNLMIASDYISIEVRNRAVKVILIVNDVLKQPV